MPDVVAYGGLFLAAFLSATLLPVQSEAALLGLLATERYPAALLLVVASVGNILGSVVNWTIGAGVERFRHRRWFPVSPRNLERAERHYRNWGHWSLLASWVPVVGDPLTVMAGVLREPLWRFVLLVSIAKAGRYLVLAAVASTWLP